MALNRPALRLICYDIAHPKRLARLHRFISHHATMLQFSVYAARLRARELATLGEGIARRIAPGEDDVRIYTLPERAEWVTLGREPFSSLPGMARLVEWSGGWNGCVACAGSNRARRGCMLDRAWRNGLLANVDASGNGWVCGVSAGEVCDD